MRKHRLPQLIKYIDVRGVNKSMIEFNANLDKLNDFFSIFPKWGISVTIKLLKELKNDSEAMCDKYFSIILHDQTVWILKVTRKRFANWKLVLMV